MQLDVTAAIRNDGVVGSSPITGTTFQELPAFSDCLYCSLSSAI